MNASSSKLKIVPLIMIMRAIGSLGLFNMILQQFFVVKYV